MARIQAQVAAVRRNRRLDKGGQDPSERNEKKKQETRNQRSKKSRNQKPRRNQGASPEAGMGRGKKA